MQPPITIHVDEYDPRPADTLAFSADWREPEGWLIKLATRSRFSHIAGVATVADRHLYAEVQRRRALLPRRVCGLGCQWADKLLARQASPEIAAPLGEARQTLDALERIRREGWTARPLLIESTTLAGLDCILQGRRVSGVQAHDPRERIRSYRGRVWLFRPTLDFQPDPEQLERLSQFLLRHLGDRYDYRQAALSASILARHSWWASPGNLHSLFCSELWAVGLELLELLALSNPSKFSPARLIHSALDLGRMYEVGEIVKGNAC